MERIFMAGPSITTKVVDGQQIIEIDLSSLSIADWALNLCLLRQDLVSSVTYEGNKRLRIKKDAKLKAGNRSIVTLTPTSVSLDVSAVELEYWEVFFLKYYRDGLAEVDHIDVEVIVRPDSGRGAYVIFKVNEVKPSMTPQEVRRKLGL